MARLYTVLSFGVADRPVEESQGRCSGKGSSSGSLEQAAAPPASLADPEVASPESIPAPSETIAPEPSLPPVAEVLPAQVPEERPAQVAEVLPAPIAPRIPLDLLSAGELFALLPFDKEAQSLPALLAGEPLPPTGFPPLSQLSAADFFAAAVPWEGESSAAAPRSELGRLLAVATRDAIGRAHRFAQPSRPDLSSAGQFFQNLNWLGVHAHAS